MANHSFFKSSLSCSVTSTVQTSSSLSQKSSKTLSPHFLTPIPCLKSLHSKWRGYLVPHKHQCTHQLCQTLPTVEPRCRSGTADNTILWSGARDNTIHGATDDASLWPSWSHSPPTLRRKWCRSCGKPQSICGVDQSIRAMLRGQVSLSELDPETNNGLDDVFNLRPPWGLRSRGASVAESGSHSRREAWAESGVAGVGASVQNVEWTASPGHTST